MNWMTYVGVGLALAFVPGLASAKDAATCGKGLICANNPETVAAALRAEGMKVEVTKDGEGDPKIESKMAGYNFSILFYGCEEHKLCDSLQFYISFEDDGKNTPQLANKWNSGKRFLQMAAMDDGTLRVSYDVSTMGGLTAANFTDVVDWWRTMLGELNIFFKDNG